MVNAALSMGLPVGGQAPHEALESSRYSPGRPPRRGARRAIELAQRGGAGTNSRAERNFVQAPLSRGRSKRAAGRPVEGSIVVDDFDVVPVGVEYERAVVA